MAKPISPSQCRQRVLQEGEWERHEGVTERSLTASPHADPQSTSTRTLKPATCGPGVHPPSLPHPGSVSQGQHISQDGGG